MTQFKGTKGEWKLEEASHYQFAITGTDGSAVCFIAKNHKDAEANIKLIIASKYLLEALLAMDELDKLPHMSEAWWEQVERCDRLRNKAVKKALNK